MSKRSLPMYTVCALAAIIVLGAGVLAEDSKKEPSPVNPLWEWVKFGVDVLARESQKEPSPNTVTFDNQSGEPALVKLVGPTSRSVEVPTGKQETVTAAAGRYFIMVRYGTPGQYHYRKGDEFTVTQSVAMRSDITITLHKVMGGTNETHPISEAEFLEDKELEKKPSSDTLKSSEPTDLGEPNVPEWVNELPPWLSVPREELEVRVTAKIYIHPDPNAATMIPGGLVISINGQVSHPGKHVYKAEDNGYIHLWSAVAMDTVKYRPLSFSTDCWPDGEEITKEHRLRHASNLVVEWSGGYARFINTQVLGTQSNILTFTHDGQQHRFTILMYDMRLIDSSTDFVGVETRVYTSTKTIFLPVDKLLLEKIMEYHTKEDDIFRIAAKNSLWLMEEHEERKKAKDQTTSEDNGE